MRMSIKNKQESTKEHLVLPGGSLCNLLKSRISLLLVGVDMFYIYKIFVAVNLRGKYVSNE
jgi:hypothetical protein